MYLYIYSIFVVLYILFWFNCYIYMYEKKHFDIKKIQVSQICMLVVHIQA